MSEAGGKDTLPVELGSLASAAGLQSHIETGSSRSSVTAQQDKYLSLSVFSLFWGLRALRVFPLEAGGEHCWKLFFWPVFYISLFIVNHFFLFTYQHVSTDTVHFPCSLPTLRFSFVLFCLVVLVSNHMIWNMFSSYCPADIVCLTRSQLCLSTLNDAQICVHGACGIWATEDDSDHVWGGMASVVTSFWWSEWSRHSRTCSLCLASSSMLWFVLWL